MVTADLTDAVGAEKGKIRPAVVVHSHARTALILPVTDAAKRRYPTHALLAGFASGTQVKDALVTCEHARSVDPSRLTPRPRAPSLSTQQLADVLQALRLALGLTPLRPPSRRPPHPRGSWVQVDYGEGRGAEASGVIRSLVLSNDTGNAFGRTLLVAPRADAHALVPVLGMEEPVDLGHLRVVDHTRIQPGPTASLSPSELHAPDARLGELLATRPPTA